eukprot:3998226-Prymnesium_polylepis.1
MSLIWLQKRTPVIPLANSSSGHFKYFRASWPTPSSVRISASAHAAVSPVAAVVSPVAAVVSP